MHLTSSGSAVTRATVNDPFGLLRTAYDDGVPTYLRWIAALSTGVTAQFIFLIATFPLAGEPSGEGAQTVVELTGITGILLTLGNALLGMMAALWVNNWILRRYPRQD